MVGLQDAAIFAATQWLGAIAESPFAIRNEIARQQGICDSIDATKKELAAYEAIAGAEATDIASMLETQQEVIKQAQDTANAGQMIDVQNAAFYVKTAISVIMQIVLLFYIYLTLS